MFGIVLPIVNRSACSPRPRAAVIRKARAKPLIRETTVPAAITALEPRIFWLSWAVMHLSSSMTGPAWCAPWWGPASRPRAAGRAHPAHEAYGDGAEEQGHAGAEDQPDHLAELG